jgi:hypothetical protein
MIKRILLGLLCFVGFACLAFGAMNVPVQSMDRHQTTGTNNAHISGCYRINRAGERILIPCNIRVRQVDKRFGKGTADKEL